MLPPSCRGTAFGTHHNAGRVRLANFRANCVLNQCLKAYSVREDERLVSALESICSGVSWRALLIAVARNTLILLYSAAQ